MTNEERKNFYMNRNIKISPIIIALTWDVVFVWAISFCVTKLSHSGKKRIKDKNGKTIYKDEYELAKEIDALDTQAKNIWEYLK